MDEISQPGAFLAVKRWCVKCGKRAGLPLSPAFTGQVFGRSITAVQIIHWLFSYYGSYPFTDFKWPPLVKEHKNLAPSPFIPLPRSGEEVKRIGNT